MSAYKLTETAVNLILEHIKDNISSALVDVRTDRADDAVNLILPQTYLIFDSVKNYRKPTIMVIAEDTDFQLLDGANHINAIHDIKVVCVCEDRNEKPLTLLSWRYQSALAKILHLTTLDSSDGKVRIVPKVVRLSYSPVYSEDGSGTRGAFCKEVMVELEVDHWEEL